MSNEDRAALPERYCMIDKMGLDPESVIALRDAADWGTERNPDVWKTAIEQSLATVGVVGPQQNLVGVGFLAGNIRHAVLCDLVVHPDHRGRGLGQAIVRRRVHLADQMRIPYLYTELASTNNLASLYEELGFVATGNAYTRAVRRHPLEQ